MIEFTAAVTDLKKALAIVALATVDSAEDIQGHALFNFPGNGPVGCFYLYSTDKDKIASSRLPVSDVKSDKTGVTAEEIFGAQFTADPRKLQALISNTDQKQIKFTYDSATKTLNVYASENSDAYVSFASFKPEEFLTFEKELRLTIDVKTFDSSMFLSAIRFIQGFLPNDDKEKKFANMFFDKGTVFGTNGSYKIGAFQSDEFSGISDLSIRRIMLSPIASMLDKTDSSTIKLSSSDKLIAISLPDDSSTFGFRRSVLTMPKMPVSVDQPKQDGFNINRTALLKKLNRLAVVSKEDVGLKMELKGTELSIETETDRRSYEKITCQRVIGDTDLEFFMECSKVKSVLNLFQASNVDIHIDKTKCIIRSAAELVTIEGEKETKKSFISVGLLALARKI